MQTIYEKPVRLLMKEMVDDLEFVHGHIFTREEVREWFKKNYPKIKNGTIAAHIIRLSVNAPSRRYYSPKAGEDDLFYQIDEKKLRLFEPKRDPAPIYDKKPGDPELPEGGAEDEFQASQAFAYEKDLQNYLARNLSLIEPGLKLFEIEGINGIEFPVGGRFVDILAVDSSGDYVVIELKVSKGYDRVVGQLLRYIAWIKKNQAEEGQKVRGIIIAREISQDLQLACYSIPDVELFEYELSVSLRKTVADTA